MNRLRPTGVKKEDLDLWLSRVIWDAIRDASEAGLDGSTIHFMLKSITDSNHPYGYQHRSHPVPQKKIEPATLYGIYGNGETDKGTVVIADFGASGDPRKADYMATFAPPPFVAYPACFHTQAEAVGALTEQVRSVLTQLEKLADRLKAEGK